MDKREIEAEVVEGMAEEEADRVGLDEEDTVIRKLVDPRLPTQAEVDKHYLSGHLPYRNWCPVCVRAKGKERDHQRDPGNDRKMPEHSWDDCFPGDEMGYK